MFDDKPLTEADIKKAMVEREKLMKRLFSEDKKETKIVDRSVEDEIWEMLEREEN